MDMEWSTVVELEHPWYQWGHVIHHQQTCTAQQQVVPTISRLSWSSRNIKNDQISVKSSFHYTCGSFTCGAHMYDVPRRYYYYLLLFTIYALPVQHGAVLTYALSFDPRVTFVALAVSAVVMFRKCTVESVLNYRRYM